MQINGLFDSFRVVQFKSLLRSTRSDRSTVKSRKVRSPPSSYTSVHSQNLTFSWHFTLQIVSYNMIQLTFADLAAAGSQRAPVHETASGLVGVAFCHGHLFDSGGGLALLLSEHGPAASVPVAGRVPHRRQRTDRSRNERRDQSAAQHSTSVSWSGAFRWQSFSYCRHTARWATWTFKLNQTCNKRRLWGIRQWT